MKRCFPELDQLAVSEQCLVNGRLCLAIGKRFSELDLLRGLAVVGMVIFHFFFILDFYGVRESDMFSGWWYVFGQFVRFIFLGLVGVGMVISYERVRVTSGDQAGRASGKVGVQRGAVVRGGWSAILRQWRRALIVGIAAMAVTVGTYFYLGEGYYVRFGILHLIAVSIFLWSFFVEWKWVVLGLSLLSFWFGGWFEWLGIANFGLSLSDFGINRFGLFFLKDVELQAIDYFPLFPWTGIVGLGIFVGRVLYSQGGRLVKAGWRENFFRKRFYLGGHRFFLLVGMALSFLGKKALLIYMVHVPVIVGFLWSVGIL